MFRFGNRYPLDTNPSGKTIGSQDLPATAAGFFSPFMPHQLLGDLNSCPGPGLPFWDGFGSCRAIEKPCRKCLPIVAVWCLFSCCRVSLLCFLAIGLDLDLPLYSGCTLQAYVCLPGSDPCSLCEVWFTACLWVWCPGYCPSPGCSQGTRELLVLDFSFYILPQLAPIIGLFFPSQSCLRFLVILSFNNQLLST